VRCLPQLGNLKSPTKTFGRGEGGGRAEPGPVQLMGGPARGGRNAGALSAAARNGCCVPEAAAAAATAALKFERLDSLPAALVTTVSRQLGLVPLPGPRGVLGYAVGRWG
jgi:hypothetical protein